MATRLRLELVALEARTVPALVDFSQLAADHTEFDSTHVLVQWRDGAAHRSSVTQSAESLGNGLYRVALKPNVTVQSAVNYFNGLSTVSYAQPDYRVHVARTPNDPSYGSLWGLNNSTTSTADISAPEAWNTGTGTGRTIVAVIDTGIDYNHPDLAANMWKNSGEIPNNGKDDDGNGFKDDVYGFDFANNDSNPMDDNGHGTHVAGTIGAVGNNGIGVSGVVWKTRLMALKFLDSSGSGYMSDAVRALNYAVANGAKVINNSYGGGGSDPAMVSALANARAKGVIFVAAAGNDGTNNDSSPSYPANYNSDNVVSVAATDRTDKLASFSNFGRTTVDIAAPGVGIYSTLPNGKYGTYSGTSMATPHVAGAMALVWDAHPTWTYRQVIDAVLNSADPVSSLSGKVATGGRLDVAGAIGAPVATTPGDSTAPSVTSVAFSGTGTGISKARVTFSEAIDASTFTTLDATLTGPSGKAIAISGVTAVSSTQFDVTFASQSAAGTYALGVGPSIMDVAGNLMTAKYSTSTTLGGIKSYASGNVGETIFDYGRVVSTITVGDNTTIRDLNVRVNVTHSYTKDLKLTLIAPDGTRVPLAIRRGGSGNNFTNTVFDDEAGAGIWQGAAPFAGTFRPESVLSVLDGKSAKGTWQLVVEDTALYDAGVLNDWSITIDPKPAAVTSSTVASKPVVANRPATSMMSPPPETVWRRITAWGGRTGFFWEA